MEKFNYEIPVILKRNYAYPKQFPYAGEEAVYQARIFIEKYYSDTIEYDDVTACLQQGIYRHGQDVLKKEITTRDFALYPNPACDKINIVIKNHIVGICKLEIINSLGAVVFTKAFNCSEKKFSENISSLSEGMYQIKVTFNADYRFISKLAIIR